MSRFSRFLGSVADRFSRDGRSRPSSPAPPASITPLKSQPHPTESGAQPSGPSSTQFLHDPTNPAPYATSTALSDTTALTGPQPEDPILTALTEPRSSLDQFVSLEIQSTLSLASVIAELAPVPYVGEVAKGLTAVFQAIEKSRVNKQQWKLLQGRCVMVIRIAGWEVQNNEGKAHIDIQVATDYLRRTLEHIAECANEWNEKGEFVAMIWFQEISDQIKGLFEELDLCLIRFSSPVNVNQPQWVGTFTTVQQQELAKLDRLYRLLETMDPQVGQIANLTREKIQEMSAGLREGLGKVIAEKNQIMQNENETVAVYVDAEEIVQIIRAVTNIQLPNNLLVGHQCILDSNVPIRSGVTCDVYLASFLTTEKVAKKVFRVGTTEKDAVERYARRFMRDAKLWATFKSDHTLPFYGIGMEASGSNKESWQLFMVSPLMLNFDAVTYLKKHRDDPGMKEGIMRIITDAAKGLQYLHGRDPPVVHSGMRGDNILITDSGGGVLGGFGLTKALGGPDAPSVVMTGKSEGYRWMAPELISSEGNPVLQTASDVWGWAMTALELISAKVPYPNARQAWQIITAIHAKKTPARDDHEDFATYALKANAIWSVLERCWAIEPDDRPTIDEILTDLSRIATREHTVSIDRDLPLVEDQRTSDHDTSRREAPSSPSVIAGGPNRSTEDSDHIITNPQQKLVDSTSSDVSKEHSQPIPQNLQPISHSTIREDVMKHLRDHGCQDLTDRYDHKLCDDLPTARGGFSDIYELRQGSTRVAIKVTRTSLTDEEPHHLKDAARELHTWSKCDHPYVHKLLGFTEFRKGIGMVSVWMENGNLNAYLSKNPKVDRCLISTQICEAVAFLHEHRIVHGDIKGSNVLISANGTPALTDFGTGIIKDRTMKLTGKAPGGMTPRWAAPELLEQEVTNNKEADVYALGMTILEAFTGKIPYAEMKTDRAFFAAVCDRKEAPLRPDDLIPSASKKGDELWNLLLGCWKWEPKDRLGSRRVADVMSTIKSKDLHVDSLSL